MLVPELANVSLTAAELDYLKNTCTYFNNDYLQLLTTFRLHPSKQIHASFALLNDTGSPDDVGDLSLDISGRWLDTILYEIPLLALTSEAYFKFCDRDWTYRHQQGRAYIKGRRLIEHGCTFSEFGSRRRRDYHTQDLGIVLLKALRKVGVPNVSVKAMPRTPSPKHPTQYLNAVSLACT